MKFKKTALKTAVWSMTNKTVRSPDKLVECGILCAKMIESWNAMHWDKENKICTLGHVSIIYKLCIPGHKTGNESINQSITLHCLQFQIGSVEPCMLNGDDLTDIYLDTKIIDQLSVSPTNRGTISCRKPNCYGRRNNKKTKQAGAELCQAQVKLGLAKLTEFVFHLKNN